MSFTSETQSRSAFRVDQRFANTSVIGRRGCRAQGYSGTG